MSAALVQLQSMTRSYGTLVAARQVSFEVQRGEMFGLIGPDGAGKTTTLRVVLGLLPPTSGRVRTCGLDPWKQGAEASKHIGYLSQRFSLYGDLTVAENVAFFAEVHGVRGWRPRAEELLDLLRMSPFRDRLADRLSGGMKQKLALAATLIHTPELLILDEPTTGVDPVSRRDFWRILSKLQRDGLTLLLTTPYLDEAERCQRVALMDKSRILSVSTPDELRESSGAAIIEVLATPRRRVMEILGAQREVEEVQAFGERLHLTLTSRAAPQAAAIATRFRALLEAAGVAVEAVRAEKPSLEDVFIARIREKAPAGRTMGEAR
jgi:ABC-2 type transport system ATP-binding protein